MNLNFTADHWSSRHSESFDRHLRDGAAAFAVFEYGASCSRFDRRHWTPCGPTPARPIGLLAERSASPAKVFDAILERPKEWAFDCYLYSWLVVLYGVRHTYGTTVFDAWMRLNGGGGFYLTSAPAFPKAQNVHR